MDKPNSSKKAVRAKKEQKIDDLTFGIKNKNKSSKVKLFIDRAEKCVKHSFGDIDAVRLPRNLMRHLNLLAITSSCDMMCS